MDKEEQRKHFNERIKYAVLMLLAGVLIHLIVIVLLLLGVDVYIPKSYQWLRVFSTR